MHFHNYIEACIVSILQYESFKATKTLFIEKNVWYICDIVYNILTHHAIHTCTYTMSHIDEEHVYIDFKYSIISHDKGNQV